MKFTYCFLSIILLFIGCTPTIDNDLKSYMVGSWQTTYLKIEMPTVHRTDSLTVIEEDFSSPNAGLAQSVYREDGAFSSWFLLPNGEKSGETAGVWDAKGKDSLYVDYFYHGKQVKAWYSITKTPLGFNAKMIYDWDNDGDYDDELFMKTKRIRLN